MLTRGDKVLRKGLPDHLSHDAEETYMDCFIIFLKASHKLNVSLIFKNTFTHDMKYAPNNVLSSVFGTP
jgi:hypothetical protein